jgi:hypothetical protein
MRGAILAVFLVLAGSSVAHALSITNVVINGTSLSTGGLVATSCGTGCSQMNLAIAGTYGAFTLTSSSTRGARVTATDTSSLDKLGFTDALITYGGTGPADLLITYEATYSVVVPTFYAVSLQGSFSRGGSVAIGDSIAMVASVVFVKPDIEGVTLTSPTQIDGTKSYLVPVSENLTVNNFGPPNPSQSTVTIACPSPTTGCFDKLSNTLTIHFASGGDSVLLPGSAASFGCETEGDCATALAQELVPQPPSFLLLMFAIGGLALGRHRSMSRGRSQSKSGTS